MPMSPSAAPAACSAKGRDVRLPAEAAERRLAVMVGQPVDAAGDAVAVGVVGSASASSVASGTASSRPRPIIAGATRGLDQRPVERAVGEVGEA